MLKFEQENLSLTQFALVRGLWVIRTDMAGTNTNIQAPFISHSVESNPHCQWFNLRNNPVLYIAARFQFTSALFSKPRLITTSPSYPVQ